MKGVFSNLLFLTCLVQAAVAQPYLAPLPDIPPWCIDSGAGNADVSVLYDGVLVQGAATVRMGSDNVFDRPVILVEGFDFGSGWDEDQLGFGLITWTRIHGTDPLNFPMGLDYRPMLDDLHAAGADLVFLDFAEGTTSLQSKTALLTHVLGLIRDHQVGSIPGVLVGVSMGGVVARMALCQWELEGSPHCIGQYHSIDAPHLGATLPVSLQALILGLSTMSETGLSLWHALNSSAAHQLLQHHIANNGMHDDIQDVLSNLGWPQRSLNFNVINSRENATAPLTSDPLLHIEWGLEWPWDVTTCFVQADRWSAPPSQGTATYALPGELFSLSGMDPLEVGVLTFPQPMHDAEAAAGSEAGHIQDLAAALMASIPLPILHSNLQTGATFVPFESALGVTDEPESPWDDVSTATEIEPRETHASLPSHHRNWLWERMHAIWHDSEVWANIYSAETSITMGWQDPLVRTLPGGLVTQEGQLVVGNAEELFEVHTSPCEGNFRAEDGGEIHVGLAPSAHGILRVGSGTSLFVGPGGRLDIHNGSTLVVEPHGHLHLEGGLVVVHDGGILEIQPQGMMGASGGMLRLDGNEATWNMQGKLTLTSGEALVVDNEGHMNCLPGLVMHLPHLSSCKINQGTEGEISMKGEMILQGSGKFEVRGGHVGFLTSGTLLAHTPTEWDDVEFVAESSSEIHVRTSSTTTLDDCELGNLLWHHECASSSPSLFKLKDCQWVHGRCAVQGGRARLTDNHFDHAVVDLDSLAYPSRLSGNYIHAAFYESTPSVSISDTPHEVWIESNRWIGGKGLEIINSRAIASCNRWEQCQTAFLMQGISSGCFSPACGGGNNRLLNNGTHFRVLNAPMPQLDFGSNHIGPVSEVVVAGETTLPFSSWTVQGASWDVSLLDNPWFSPIPASLFSNASGVCTPVSCFAQDIVAESGCDDTVSEKPLTKAKPLQRLWNVLGQSVLHRRDAINPTD
ncbi:MAG: hypothetical protein O2990_00280 [Bacteroidetes bacterium]|nr:hypothetical protein [Bacteroidota bacterium]